MPQTVFEHVAQRGSKVHTGYEQEVVNLSARVKVTSHLHSRQKVSILSKLAKMLVSLVRVSRRENATHEIQQQASKSSEMMPLQGCRDLSPTNYT